MRRAVRPNTTTLELDAIAGKLFRRAGARSAPQLDYDFPGVTCISVNDEAVHGIPSRRRLSDGDLVKLDVTAELDGFYADACVSVPVGTVAPRTQRLVAAASSGLRAGMRAAVAGDVHVMPDRWTVRTDDGSVSAHVEHTVVIRDGAPPLILTA